ncbi:MAG: LuxR C-terminal-related transcriptional regulator [Solirubrobacteraceae bacterium]
MTNALVGSSAHAGRTGSAVQRDGWGPLFAAAFRDSRNAMVLVDERRRHVDANGAYLQLLGYAREDIIGRPIYEFVVGGPLASQQEWAALLGSERETGELELACADGTAVGVQWGATPEVVTGRRLVLFAAMSTSRWGRRFRRSVATDPDAGPLSPRELEIVRLVALGGTGPEIADELLLAHDTVRTHVRNAMTKVGARSRAHLVAKALAEGHALA